MEELIRQLLTNTFNPEYLEIENQSARHDSHRSSPGNGDSHFSVVLRADCLNGMNRIEQHRHVHAALEEAFKKGLHAISLKINPI